MDKKQENRELTSCIYLPPHSETHSDLADYIPVDLNEILIYSNPTEQFLRSSRRLQEILGVWSSISEKASQREKPETTLDLRSKEGRLYLLDYVTGLQEVEHFEKIVSFSRQDYIEIFKHSPLLVSVSRTFLQSELMIDNLPEHQAVVNSIHEMFSLGCFQIFYIWDSFLCNAVQCYGCGELEYAFDPYLALAFILLLHSRFNFLYVAHLIESERIKVMVKFGNPEEGKSNDKPEYDPIKKSFSFLDEGDVDGSFTPIENQIIHELMISNRESSIEILKQKIWVGKQHPQDQTVLGHIKSIRRKLRNTPITIETNKFGFVGLRLNMRY